MVQGCNQNPIDNQEISFGFPMIGGEIWYDFAERSESIKYVEIKMKDFSEGTVVVSADGVVDELGEIFNEKVNYIKIKHENGLTSYYTNLKDLPELNKGDQVKKGDILGVTSCEFADCSLGFVLLDKDNNRLENTSSYIVEK